ncbi:DUF4268 domain-containing protein [Hyunsoonleella pacifica]|uniref:DUF4268 domain-containing protein n=1 Tax=Hyunsoonleella pacifica TaxID=1080224 RepID=A0A4Q9FUY1_9FLAO|nr:DUF4268 domain-containing protein [Hyunsoonleella pacifica]TBN19049.1 DUF4268 domain-containing protein [Hyunsoonleella pacifica]GGD06913.1 hypothetical protein GCM10011368_05970 [Hyunsoonleella pacifica]
MFSKEESRILRQEFWTSFGKSFPRKWILYNTKLKGLSFKFYFDTKKALVTLDLEDDLEHRITYWEKLEALKSILMDDYLPDVIYEEVYFLDNKKEISRIYVLLEQKVSIHNKNTWRDVMVFFNNKMDLFEAFFLEYKEVIEG